MAEFLNPEAASELSEVADPNYAVGVHWGNGGLGAGGHRGVKRAWPRTI